MSDKINGVVEKKAKSGKGLYINGQWYNTGFPVNLEGIEVGMNVEFSAKVNGTSAFINGKPKVIGATIRLPVSNPAASGGSQPPSDIKISRERCIVRQNATTSAARIVAAAIGTGVMYEDEGKAIVSIARDIEAYTTGDMDEEMKEEFTKMDDEF